jgi:hypothetical protein
LVDTLSIFLVVALPPRKDLFPVRLIPAHVIGTALFAALLAVAFVIGNTVLAVLGTPCLEIGAAPFPLLRCQRLSAHWTLPVPAAAAILMGRSGWCKMSPTIHTGPPKWLDAARRIDLHPGYAVRLGIE